MKSLAIVLQELIESPKAKLRIAAIKEHGEFLQMHNYESPTQIVQIPQKWNEVLVDSFESWINAACCPCSESMIKVRSPRREGGSAYVLVKVKLSVRRRSSRRA